MFRQYRKIESGEFFVVFADTATGLGDYCACQFLSYDKRDIPLVYHSDKLATEMTDELFPILNKIHEITRIKPVIAYERNNGGVFELERLAALNKAGNFEIFKMPNYGIDYSNKKTGEPDPVKYGWDTNTATRPKMLSEWKEAIDKKLVMIYDRPTINEHFSFIIATTSSSVKAQAEKGAHDDLVMSAAGAWQLYQMCNKPVINNFNQYRNRAHSPVDDDLGI